MSGMPDVSTIDDYGGELSNYAPPEDPTTDRDAGAMNQALEDTAQVTHTACRAWARITLEGASPATIVASDAGWGNSVPPTVTHLGAGSYSIAWMPATVPAGTVTDGLGKTHLLELQWATATVEGSTLAFAQGSTTGTYAALVYTFNAAGAANDLAGVTILVRAG